MAQVLPPRSRAVVQTGPSAVEIRELELPAPASDAGWLRVEACGLCGTDLDQYLDRHGNRSFPAVLGHEPVGRVVALGEVAASRGDVRVGDRVAVEVMLPCGRCARCRTGRTRSCPRRRAERRAYSTMPTATPPGLWGGFAEYLYLDPATVLHQVPPDIPAEVAVMFNALANAVEWSLLTPGTRAGDDVLLLGCGQRALMAVVALRAAGARRVIVTGLPADRHKLDLARALGADVAVEVGARGVAETVREVTGGAMVDTVVDLTPGATDALGTAVDAVRDGGTIVLAGIKGGAPSPLDTDRFVTRELTLRSGLSASYEAYERAIALLAAHTATFARLHTHTFPLERAEQALRTLAGHGGEPAICVSLAIAGHTPKG